MDNHHNNHESTENTGDISEMNNGANTVRKSSMQGVKSKINYFSGMVEKSAGKMMKKQEWVNHGEKLMADNKTGNLAKSTAEGVETAAHDIEQSGSKMASDLNVKNNLAETANNIESTVKSTIDDANNI
ncbi:hypothetical protein BB561_000454 [Smittium simulii]|uniref:Uncharacterized protein n=1 Tax=Smittium simulii TaxID=133385 RepID=A0A2T9YZ55_9FUNG|nr:hypothetical protein BB561_000454 [Smittium simulii]